MTLASAVIEQAKREILAGAKEQVNKLSATIDSDDVTLTFTYPLRGIQQGAVIEIESEQMMIWETPSTSSATVERGFNGTTAVEHTAPQLVAVNPKFSRQVLFDFLNHELIDLSSPWNGLFAMQSADLPYNQDGHDIPLTLSPAPLNTLYAVRYRAMSREWPLIRKWEMVRDQNTDEFGADGLSLRLFDDPASTGLLRIQWKSPFEAVTSLSQDLSTITGGTDLDEILKLGIQIRAAGIREIKRNFTEAQGEPRRAEEVPPGAVGNSPGALVRLRRDRIAAEAARLNARYPQRLRS